MPLKNLNLLANLNIDVNPISHINAGELLLEIGSLISDKFFYRIVNKKQSLY